MSKASEYLAIQFDTTGYDQEIWLAFLIEWPFEAFEESGEILLAYILQEDFTPKLEETIAKQQGLHFKSFRKISMPYQNWNAIWESSFQPVAVDDYVYIRAQFHDPAPEGFKHEIIIAPKMAFGTGHHETTYMMLQAMSKIQFDGKRVLDFGCGTGILSVVAAREGASEVIGVDIQPEAIENSEEHSHLNHTTLVCKFFEGGLEKAGTKPFDIILANINTHVLMESMVTLESLCNKGAVLLLSGILIEDVEEINRVLIETNLTIQDTQKRDEWVQFTMCFINLNRT